MATYFKVFATYRKILLVVDEDLCAVFSSKVAIFVGAEIDAKSENVMQGCPYKVIRKLIKICFMNIFYFVQGELYVREFKINKTRLENILPRGDWRLDMELYGMKDKKKIPYGLLQFYYNVLEVN